MNFDYQEFEWLPALGRWAIVFFTCFSAGAVLALLFAPLVAGRGGRGTLLSHLTRGALGPVCWAAGIAAAGGLGYLAWWAGGVSGTEMAAMVQAVGATTGEPAARAILAAVCGLFAGVGGFFLIPTLLDSLTWSLRRIWSVAALTWKESVRRRALYVFVVFALLFMFAGWFLSGTEIRPDMLVKNYVGFVLTVISYLIIPVVLLLACWAIPEEIRTRSLHTVVTKPIRRSEIYLGRILGFTMVGTVVLLVMGAIGYAWIARQVPASVTTGEAVVAGELVKFGRIPDGGLTVTDTDDEGEPRITVVASEAELRQQNPELHRKYRRARETYVAGLLTSRVPVHGTLTFYDREGRPSDAGINVGDVWEHRSYIEGGTKARASYLFEDFKPGLMIDTTEVVDGKRVPVKRLRLESTFEAFRSHKGDLNQSVLVQYHFVKDLRRETALAVAGQSADSTGVARFAPLANAIRAGNFGEAANQFTALGNALVDGQISLSGRERSDLAAGYERLAELMLPLAREDRAPWAAEMISAARSVANAARQNRPDEVGESLIRIGALIGEHTESVAEHVVDLDVALAPFNIEEYGQNVMLVDPELPLPGRAAAGSGAPRTVNLFEDVVHGGRLRIEVGALDPGQYLGMARPDLFVRTPDRPFVSGYAKALVGVWLMMILVIVFGVTASTFVKGPVATLLTLVVVLVGLFFHDFMQDVVSGKLQGSGTFESMHRIAYHLNPMTDLDETTTVRVMQGADQTIMGGLWIVVQVIPDLSVFSLSQWVANGFDVPWDADAGLAACFATTLAYLLPCLVLGYHSLKLRELEAK